MAKKKSVLFRSKELRDTSNAAALLRDIADKMEKGELVIQQGDEKVVLSFGNRIGLSFLVTEKDGKRGKLRRMKLSLRWIEGEAEKKVTIE